MPTRRSILRTLSAAPVLMASPAIRADTDAGTAHAPPWWLVAPMTAGTTLDGEWRITDLGPIQDGASVMQLSHPEQESLRIHLCLHEGSPKGFAHTELFDLIVIDHGRGVRKVPDDLAPALKQLAEAIQDNELANNSAFAHVADMMTHKERVSAFGASQIQ